MTHSSSKADLYPPEPTINGVVATLFMEALGAEAGGAQHPAPSSPQRLQCLAPVVAPATSTREKNERENSNKESEECSCRERKVKMTSCGWVQAAGESTRSASSLLVGPTTGGTD
jgi:hypothetical protein